MSIPSHLRFAVPTSRLLVALALFTGAAMLALYSFAAVPPNGTLTPANRSITYTDGPLVSNPTHLVFGMPECAAPNSCSDFTLTISASSLAATHNFVWTMQWPVPNVDCDMFIVKDGNLVSANIGYSDPSHLALPVPADGTVYHLITSCSVGTNPLTGTAALVPKYPTAGQGPGAPPRYINYTGTANQATDAGEPSIGVDWNPNVPALKHEKVNTGGVTFFTSLNDQWRVNFDDCSSPAVNLWEDTNAPIFDGLDPIGFVDHYSNQPLGLTYPPVKTPGRVYGLQLAAGSSTAAFSDNDGNAYVPFLAGGPPAGADHETFGGGPYHAPIPTPPPPAYPNPMYYCSQFGAEQASCSRSDDGGVTFGPGVPIFPPTQCAGGIHGHLKVSPQGTVYVPNSACAEGTGPGVGVNGVARSRDKGITWDDQTVPGSTGSSDPSIGIGQNNVGKPAGQTANTIYLGWISADGHAHIAHSPDEGETWQDETDVASIFGIEKCVFPTVVAGDDNRAAYAFLGTVPQFYPAKQVWHAYLATSYDGGKTWILVDLTPDDPVQIGGICLLGTGCNGGRNLLDFNGIDIDAEGRVLFAYADGCVNCTDNQAITQSNAAKGTIARQSGGRRLFAAFDPIEPAPPAAPRILSAVRVSDPAPGGVLVSWLEPDNGGSPVTGYKIYRSQTSGTETLLTTVSGANSTKFLDTTAPSTSNWFYRITAFNAQGEGDFCRELNVNGAQPVESACVFPYLTAQTDATGDQTGAPALNTQLDIQRLAIGEPFTTCADKSLTFIMKTATLAPAPPAASAWMVLFNAPGTTNTLFVQMDTQTSGTSAAPGFNYGYIDGNNAKVVQCGRPNGPSPCPVSGSFLPDGTIVMKLDTAAPLKFFSLANTGATPDFTVNIPIATALTNISGKTEAANQTTDTTGTATYTTAGNLACVETLPVAVLTASPLVGPAPLTVNFDASQSFTENPCAAIATYTMDFGDGSALVTQASPLFSHVYNNPGQYPARLSVSDAAGQASVNPAELVITAEGPLPPLLSVVSRRVHGNAGPFDINLSLSGRSAVECRRGGTGNSYQIIFKFDRAVTVAGASVTPGPGGTATASAPTMSAGGTEATVALSNVSDAQTLVITLTGVSDNGGATTKNLSVQMGVLIADTNGDRAVNSGDAQQTRNRSGQLTDTTNFRSDVNTDGAINSGDAFIVRGKSGGSLNP